MKKLLASLLPAVAALAFLMMAASSASGAIDTSSLVKAFQNASPADKAEVQNALTALQSHDYPGAMTSLGKLASNPNLTSTQKSAVQDTLKQAKNEQMGAAQGAIGGGAGNLTNQAPQDMDKATEGFKNPFKP